MHSHQNNQFLSWNEAEKRRVGSHLHKLFAKKKPGFDVVVPKGEEIKSPGTKPIVLNNVLVGRQSKRHPHWYHFDAYDVSENIGSGCTGTVRRAKYKVTIDLKNGNFIKIGDSKNKVAKWASYFSSQIAKNETLREYNFTRRNIKLGCTIPSFIYLQGKSYSVMRMNFIPDRDLSFDDLRPDFFAEVNKLTNLEVAYYLAALMITYESTVEENGFHHLDLKAANVRIKPVASGEPLTSLQITILDHNLSRAVGSKETEAVGTMLYAGTERFQAMSEYDYLKLYLMPKEVIPKPVKAVQTISTDIYYLGWICARFLGADDCPAETVEEAILWAHYCMQRMTNLFHERPLENPYQAEYREILGKMFSEQPIDRPSPREVLDVFEAILLDFYLTAAINSPEVAYPRAIETGFREGVQLRKTLHDFAISYFCEDIDKLQHIQKAINASLGRLPNQSSAIHHFLDRANLDFLKNIDFADAKTKIDMLVKSYINNHNKIIALREEVLELISTLFSSKQLHKEIAKLKEIIAVIDKLRPPQKTYPLRIDNIHYFNEKYKKHLPRLEQQLIEIKLHLPTPKKRANLAKFFTPSLLPKIAATEVTTIAKKTRPGPLKHI